MSYEKVNLFLDDQPNGNQISCQIKKSKRAKKVKENTNLEKFTE